MKNHRNWQQKHLLWITPSIELRLYEGRGQQVQQNEGHQQKDLHRRRVRKEDWDQRDENLLHDEV